MRTKTTTPQKICQATDCSTPLTGRQKKFCSRRCTTITRQARMTPEQRSAHGRMMAIRLNSKFTPEQRSERQRRALAKVPPEQRSANARKAAIILNASMTPEERRARSRKGTEHLTLEERRQNAYRGGVMRHLSWLRSHSSKTPEGRAWQAAMLQSIQDEIDQLEREMLNGRKH